MSNRVAAFFDIDGTLLKENTNSYYLKTLYKDKKIGILVIIKGLIFQILYKANHLTLEQMSHFSINFMKGWDKFETEQYAKRLFDSDLKGKLSEKMINEVKTQRDRGNIIVLLTNASDLISKQFQKYLGADYCVGSILESENGKLTGRFSKICYKENKLKYFEEFVKEHNIDISKSFFYSDSYSDIAVLQAIGDPIIVNPDKKLKRIGMLKGWKIITY
jgi:HAD superfamily hydrolase (TIGR01490 family)